MRWTGMVAALGIVALAAGAGAEEFYRWVDATGQVHYSNSPTVGERGTVMETENMPAPAAPAANNAETETFLSADLKRSALESDLRAAKTRIQEIDARLADLQRARTAHAEGSASTGGLGTNAADVRSPEEEPLLAEKTRLQERAAEIRGQGDELRNEVTGQLGRTPGWWADVQ